jgi:hypothetical protein
VTLPLSSSVSIGHWDDVSYVGPAQWQSTALDLILEYVPELFWPQASEVYNRMRNDAQIAGSLNAWMLPIRRADWAVDPAGCRPTVYRLVADDLGLPILGEKPRPSGARRRRVVWSDHLRVALQLRGVFGHAPFEQTYDTSSGLARLDTLVERLPKTIFQIFVDPKTGDIDHVTQNRYAGQPTPPRISRAGLVWYVNDREGLGWRGRSLMRPAYPYWLIKNEMLRVQATGHRRFNNGIPYMNTPAGATPNQIQEADRAMGDYRVSDTSRLTLPYGFTAGVAGVTGQIPDTLGFTKYLDEQMSISFLTQWLNLGTTQSGARALAETFVDMFTQSIQDYGDAQADQATAQIVVPLVNTNWGEDEPAPRIVCGNVGANHTLTAAAISELYTCGALTGDPELENAVRQMFKLPLRDPDAPRPVAGADIPTDAAAPAMPPVDA